METFQIRASSWVIYILTLLTVIFGGSALEIALLPTKGNSPIAIAMTVIVIGGAFYATRFTARALTEWTITENEIQLRWLGQFIFHNKPDLNFSWSDIQEYKFQPDRNFDLFKLKLTDGRTIKLWHNTSTTNDDFQKFVSSFEGRVQTYNTKDSDASNDIKRSKTIYETKLGLALAIFAGLCLVAIPILIAVLPNKSKINWAGFGLAYAGGLFFIFQVLAYRKKKSSSLH
jgi:hypothetical protein